MIIVFKFCDSLIDLFIDVTAVDVWNKFSRNAASEHSPFLLKVVNYS